MDNREKIKKRIEDLRKKINYHNYLYYVKNSPEISDYDFDMLLKELEALEREYPEFCSPTSPTQRVGGISADGFKKYTHRSSMLSLANTYNDTELIEFERRIRRIIGDRPFEYICELKIDGLSISLVYERGELVVAATRGNGLIGENVTENIKRIPSVPLRLFEPVTITVRGEIFMPIKSFEELNRDRLSKGLSPFANPRNAAAGTIRQLNPGVVSRRKLDIFIHSLGGIEGINIERQSDMFRFLDRLGFKINNEYRVFKDINGVIDYCKMWNKRRMDLEYEIDGIVIKVNEFKYHDILGTTSKSPKWAIAYKFSAPNGVSRLLDVIFQIGKSGVLTPVAVLEPINIGGVVVKRASLHNMDEIDRLGVMIGDYVVVERAAEVIPHIVMVLKDRRNGSEKQIISPKKCPSCNKEVVKDGIFIRCVNHECPSRIKKYLAYFVSRDAMNIENFGESLIDKLVDKGIIKDISDIYKLKIEDISSLENMGLKSAKKIIKSIEKSKDNSFEKVLVSLSIPGIGTHLSEILAEKFHNIDNIINAEFEELINIPEIGNQLAYNIVNFFKDKRNIQVIERLKRYGLKMNKEGPINNGKLSEKSFVITGTLSKTRKEIENLIKSNGGRVKSSVSKDIDYLIVGDNPGSKLDKAKKLGIKIINEKELMDILRD